MAGGPVRPTMASLPAAFPVTVNVAFVVRSLSTAFWRFVTEPFPNNPEPPRPFTTAADIDRFAVIPGATELPPSLLPVVSGPPEAGVKIEPRKNLVTPFIASSLFVVAKCAAAATGFDGGAGVNLGGKTIAPRRSMPA